MERSRFVVFVGTLMAIVCSNGNAHAALPVPKPAATPAEKLTAHQSSLLKQAADNLLRGYSDLKATPPDVKGDTARLEGHMVAAINLLHKVDPAHIKAPPTNIPIADKGHTRAYILSAVKGHLDKAKDLIESAKVEGADVALAVQNIDMAEKELAEAGAVAPVK